MFESFSIENFKCFHKLEISDLGRITLVGGENNVGKTALLEALFLLHDRGDPKMVLRQFAWRGIEKVLMQSKEIWSPIFNFFDTSKEIKIATTINQNYEEMRIKYNPDSVSEEVQSYEMVREVSELAVSTNEQTTPSVALDITYRSGDLGEKTYETGKGGEKTASLYFTPAGVPVLKTRHGINPRKASFIPAKSRVSESTEKAFSGASTINKEAEIIECLQMIEPKLKDLKVVTSGPTPAIHAQVDGFDQTIPVALMGDGVGKLLEIIAHVINNENGVIFIDEIEDGLHWSVLEKVWKSIAFAAKKYNCQVLATTHSYECISAMHKGLADQPEELKYVRLDSIDDQIKAKVFDYKKLDTVISGGLEIR